MRVIRRAWSILVDAVMGWINDDALSLGAAIAFCTIFSLAPLMILVTGVAGLVFTNETAQAALVEEVSRLIGPEAAETVRASVTNSSHLGAGIWATAVGIGTILIGSTTVFAQLQTALNRIWKVEPPTDSTVTWLVKARLRGLALIAAIGFLLIVSLVVSAGLAALHQWMNQYLAELAVLLWVVETLASLAVFTVLFAAIYRVLPDTYIPWSDLWLGAATTAILFAVGKTLIGLYLGTSGIASVYGAAGSFVLILLWVYYSATLFLFGAELTRAYSEQIGSRVRVQGESLGETRKTA
ncbi:YihY/virulence factor BrkB family protein [Azospirillum sp. SYSU D00513]|uniref:YihY/virulence factor BrkB family protein n=1 Tax=Azospirillum sp. SYSU D00513 TaxID=2812561 RepID=UPI001A9567B6|nr:YihY/virulence factor BrkB family protein [Azospirillum sp. SYSU D00513]